MEGLILEHPELAPFVVSKVKSTGKIIGTGSYGKVEEVAIPGTVCVAKHIHSFLQEGRQHGQKLSPEFVKECKIMSDLRHPHIVKFLGICVLPSSATDSGSTVPAILMEKMTTSLHDFLEPETDLSASLDPPPKPLIPLSLKRSILQNVASGLTYLHEQSPPIIHRDLSARNVLLNSGIVAKIADLGMARIIESMGKASSMTKAPGASLYMPPEALAACPGDVHRAPKDRDKKATYDSSIDVFSFGVVSIFVLSQTFPCNLLTPTYRQGSRHIARTELERREEYMEIIYHQLDTQHPLIQMIKRCLDFPEKRPSTLHIMETLNTLQLMQELEVQTEIRKKLEDEVKSLQQRQENMEQICAATREENVAYKKEIEEMKQGKQATLQQSEDIELLKGKLASSQTRIEETEKELQALVTKHSEMLKHYEKKIHEMDGVVAKMRTHNQHLQDRLSEANVRQKLVQKERELEKNQAQQHQVEMANELTQLQRDRKREDEFSRAFQEEFQAHKVVQARNEELEKNLGVALDYLDEMKQKQEVLKQALVAHRVELPFVETEQQPPIFAADVSETVLGISQWQPQVAIGRAASFECDAVMGVPASAMIRPIGAHNLQPSAPPHQWPLVSRHSDGEIGTRGGGSLETTRVAAEDYKRDFEGMAGKIDTLEKEQAKDKAEASSMKEMLEQANDEVKAKAAQIKSYKKQVDNLQAELRAKKQDEMVYVVESPSPTVEQVHDVSTGLKIKKKLNLFKKTKEQSPPTVQVVNEKEVMKLKRRERVKSVKEVKEKRKEKIEKMDNDEKLKTYLEDELNHLETENGTLKNQMDCLEAMVQSLVGKLEQTEAEVVKTLKRSTSTESAKGREKGERKPLEPGILYSTAEPHLKERPKLQQQEHQYPAMVPVPAMPKAPLPAPRKRMASQDGKPVMATSRPTNSHSKSNPDIYTAGRGQTQPNWGSFMQQNMPVYNQYPAMVRASAMPKAPLPAPRKRMASQDGKPVMATSRPTNSHSKSNPDIYTAGRGQTQPNWGSFMQQNMPVYNQYPAMVRASAMPKAPLPAPRKRMASQDGKPVMATSRPTNSHSKSNPDIYTAGLGVYSFALPLSSHSKSYVQVELDHKVTELPLDPNLECVICGMVFKIGEIQKFRRHSVNCSS